MALRKTYGIYLLRAKKLGVFFSDDFDDLKGQTKYYIKKMLKANIAKKITTGCYEWSRL